MGEAKRRGTFEQRRAEALKRDRAVLPRRKKHPNQQSGAQRADDERISGEASQNMQHLTAVLGLAGAFGALPSSRKRGGRKKHKR